MRSAPVSFLALLALSSLPGLVRAGEAIPHPPFWVSTVQATGPETWLLHWPAQPGQLYWLEASQSLSPEEWESVGSVVTGGHTGYAADAQGSPQASTRFWRVEAAGRGEPEWTDLPALLAQDSRIVYLSAQGNDTLAAQVHGRGYFLPGDPEIGPDPTLPAAGWASIQAYATLAAAKARLRDASGNTLEGEPEWILFRRGDTIQTGTGGLITRREAGRSPLEPRVITAYGPVSLPRPILKGQPGTWIQSWEGGNYVVSSLDLQWPTGVVGTDRAPGTAFSIMYGASNIVLEDVRFPQSVTCAIQLGPTNITLRRCVMSGNWSDASHVQAIFLTEVENVLIEECVFDLNGYKEDPLRPETWTRDVNENGMAVGTGVQPRRTFFDRNLYLSRYRNLKLRGNIIARGGGGGSVQMRVGGVAERNAFIWNEISLGLGHTQAGRAWLHDGAILQNLVLHDDHMLPPGGFGQGLMLAVGESQTGRMVDNVVAHFHRINNGGSLLGAGGIAAYLEDPAQRAFRILIERNLAITKRHNSALGLASTESASGVQQARVVGNRVALTEVHRVAVAGDLVSSLLVEFDRNRYFAVGDQAFRRASSNDSFSAWQAAGYDPSGAAYSSLSQMAEAERWLRSWQLGDHHEGDPQGWERDIVSYLKAVDPFFSPDEEVTVDAGVPEPNRRAGAPLVWQVMRDYRGYPHDHPSRPPMPEAEARLLARRYHAFLTFMERAKSNRRGDWHPAYTADALNNYIRAGFGLAPVRGPYTGSLSSED